MGYLDIAWKKIYMNSCVQKYICAHICAETQWATVCIVRLSVCSHVSILMSVKVVLPKVQGIVSAQRTKHLWLLF